MEEIKITLNEIVQTKPCFESLMNKELNVMLSFKIMKMFDEIIKNINIINKSRENLIKKYNIVDEKSENYKEFYNQCDKLFKTETTMIIEKISIEELSTDIKIKPVDLYQLKKFLI